MSCCFGRRKDGKKSTFGSADWIEIAEHHLLVIDLPGIPESELTIDRMAGYRMVIHGSREDRKYNSSDVLHQLERKCGQFSYDFRFPPNSNIEDATASMGEGVLTVMVPKQGIIHYVNLDVPRYPPPVSGSGYPPPASGSAPRPGRGV